MMARHKTQLVTIVPHGWWFFRLVWIAVAISALAPLVLALIVGLIYIVTARWPF